MLQNDIKEAIKANLTQEVGTVLTERLKQADEFEEKCINLEKREHDLLNQVSTRDRHIKELKATAEEHRTLDLRYVEVEKREKAQDIFKLECQLEGEKAKVDHTMSINDNLSRNTTVKKRVFGTDLAGVSGAYSDNGCHYPSEAIHANVDKTETIEEK